MLVELTEEEYEKVKSYLSESTHSYTVSEKKEILTQVFEMEELDETSPTEFEGKEMQEYDVITYFKWSEDDTLTVSFNFIDDKLELTDFSKHFTVTDDDGYLRVEKDSVLEAFVDKESAAWRECFEV